MYRFLIADDHAVVRRGISEILTEAFPLCEIRAVGSAEELMSYVVKEQWDLVITDISMPGRSGLELLHDLTKEYPQLPVLILSMHHEEEYAVRVIKAGGAGYLNKDAAIEAELARAADTILHGRKYIAPGVAEILARELSADVEKQAHELLSDREFEVMKLIAQGVPTGRIAEQLSISVHTVGSFRRRIFAKMNMKTNAEIVAYAIRQGLI